MKTRGIPELKILPINKLLLHERVDPKRAERLADQITKDNFLKNPILVAKIKNESKYLLLDGATRLESLKKLKCKDVVVQILDYDSPIVKLNIWYHLIPNFKEKNILKKFEKIPYLSIKNTTRKTAVELLKKKKIFAYCVFKGDKTIILSIEHKDLKKRIDVWNRVVDVYSGYKEVYRVKNEEIKSLLRYYKDAVTIVFRDFKKEEIVRLALKGIKLPAGTTRHIIPNRVLGLDIDLSILKADIPIKYKNILLEEKVKEKMISKRLRFYPEPVFSFNE